MREMRDAIFRRLVFAAVAALTAVTGASADDVPQQAARRVELLTDPAFAGGFRLNDRHGEERTIAASDGAAGAPAWEIRQHGSRSNLAEARPQPLTNGGMEFRDAFARLAVRSTADAADLVLALNADREYDGRFRAAGDPWPHLYVSQRIAAPNGTLGDRTPTVAELERLDFSLDVRLLYDRRRTDDGYAPSRHAAQLVCFFTVQNLNRHSAGYGDYFWFGTCLYDDRRETTSLHAMRDKSSAKKQGTEKLIYDVGLRPFTERVVARGERVEVRGDLLPHIRAGLQEAWRQGYLADSHDEADYRVASFLLGWEIPGLNDAAAAVRGLGATAVVRAAENPSTP